MKSLSGFGMAVFEGKGWIVGNRMPQFARYIGIDYYSGAETADSSCKGLRVFMAEGTGEPMQVLSPTSTRRYWTRRGLAELLCNELGGETPTIVGIDHCFQSATAMHLRLVRKNFPPVLYLSHVNILRCASGRRCDKFVIAIWKQGGQ
jgi:hypothetical protein